ncbi:MAG: type II toxin-antitoxin system HicB family antitoxin [bacterium]|nr:type II toxin-antitoxin system HicB family antitoxin [bacterium]
MKKIKQKKGVFPFAIEVEREEDGRWIVEIPDVPGAMAYGTTRAEALRRAYAVALRTLADTVEQGSMPSAVSSLLGHGMARS